MSDERAEAIAAKLNRSVAAALDKALAKVATLRALVRELETEKALSDLSAEHLRTRLTSCEAALEDAHAVGSRAMDERDALRSERDEAMADRMTLAKHITRHPLSSEGPPPLVAKALAARIATREGTR